MALSNAELACVYAALILVDDEVAITVSQQEFHEALRYSKNLFHFRFRVKNSPPSWKQPTLKLSLTGPASSPKLLKELMLRIWFQTSDQEPELHQQQEPLHPPPQVICQQQKYQMTISNVDFYPQLPPPQLKLRRKRRRRNPKLLMTTWDSVSSIKHQVSFKYKILIVPTWIFKK